MADRRMTPQARATRLGTSLDWGYWHGQALPYTMQRSPRPRPGVAWPPQGAGQRTPRMAWTCAEA